MMNEFIIGLQPTSVELTPNSNIQELILITESISNITIVGSQSGTHDSLSAILFNDGAIDLRVNETKTIDDAYFDHPDPKKEGLNDAASNLIQTLKLNARTAPFMDEIILQQTCYSASDQPHLYWRKITYIRLQAGDKFVEIGTLRSESESIPGQYLILPEEVVDGPCMISGVGLHNGDLLCLQIVAKPQISDDPTLSLRNVSAAKHMYAYGKSTVGLVNLKRDGKRLSNLEKSAFIGIEECTPDTMKIVSELYGFMYNWYSSRSSINRMYPDLYSLIDQSITENDRSTIFSVLRLDRHLRWRIQQEKTDNDFDRDTLVRLKLFKVVECLANTLEQCQRIIVNKPKMDCFCVGYLTDDITSKAIATLVLATQTSLTYVLFLSIYFGNNLNASVELKETVVITPIIAIFSTMLVFKQVSNTLAMLKAYPEMSKTIMGGFELFVNFLLGLGVLVIQIILVTRQDNRVEYVLNSIATIFILELDDTVVFVDEDGITDLNRQLLLKDFSERIKSIDNNLFKYKDWRTARNTFELDKLNCNIKPLPPVAFDVEETEGNKNKEDVPTAQLEPTAILIQDEEEQKNFHKASDSWEQVFSSKSIVQSKLKDDSKAELSFTWRDQGFGNRKGCLRVRLIDCVTGVDIASSPEYGIAPHESETKREIFGFNHGLVRNAAKGYYYVVEVIVGGGGGHALYIQDFSFVTNFCYSEASEEDTSL